MTSPEHLKGIVANIVRAEEHFKTLHKEVIPYLEACRDTTQLPTKINTEKKLIRLQFRPFAAPDPRISIIIGDCVHNLRSALDHLWKRLGGHDNFPMLAMSDGKKGWTAMRARLLVDIPSDAHAIIDLLQPCSRSQDASSHPLFILNRLSNIDKHDTIHLTRPRSTNTRFAFREKGTSRDVYVIQPAVVFHDQTEVLITDVPEGTVKPDMDVNIQGTLFVSFKEPGPWGQEPIQEVLRRLLDFVKHSAFVPLAPFTK